MIEQYLKRNRTKLLPYITDWTKPYDEIRHSNNVKDMDYQTWFWFHPTAYHLLGYYGMVAVPLTFSIVAGILLELFKHKILAVFCFVLALLCFIYLIKRIKNWKKVKYMTFYDFYLRDYPLEVVMPDSEVKIG